MTIVTIHLQGKPEPFDETLRHFFASNWDDTKTNNVTPRFISPNGIDDKEADLGEELKQVDVGALQTEGLIAFETANNRIDPTLSSAGNIARGKASDVLITIYSRTKYEGFLFAEQINDIIQDNLPNTDTRIKKSNSTEDSAIMNFEKNGVGFAEPRLQDKDGHVYVSTGTIVARWSKIKTS